MKVPTKRDECDVKEGREWVVKYLTEFEERRTPDNQIKSLSINSLDIYNATAKGDSYQGDIFKLDITARVQNNRGSRNVEYHHIIKFTTQDTIQKEFNKVFKDPNREFVFHNEILVNLNEFQAKKANNKFPIHMPEYVYVEKNDEGHVLVIENMKKKGYKNKSKTDLLDINEAKIALEQLARLHAVSYAYYKSKKTTKKKNIELTKKNQEKNIELTKEKNIFSVEDTSKWFISSQEHFIDIALDFLMLHEDHIEKIKKVKYHRSSNPQEEDIKTTKMVDQNRYKELIEKISSSKPYIAKKNQKAFGERNKMQKIFCLNHGDLWNNNILVRSRNQSKSPISVYFTDWENVHWNTPAYDLNYFVAGALTPKLRLGHLDELLKHYHDHFTDVTKALRKNKAIWTYKLFKDEFDAVSDWGFLKSLRFSMTLSEAGKDIKMVNNVPGTSCCTTNCLSKKIKENVGGLMVWAMNGCVLDKFTYKMMRKYTEPVFDELISKIPDKENPPALYVRFLANIKEGEARGFFDVPLEDKASNDDTENVHKTNHTGNGKDNDAFDHTSEETRF